MAKEKVSVYVDMLEKAGRETIALAGRIGPEKRFVQTRVGKATPTWLLGHLAGTLDMVLLGWGFGQAPQLVEAHGTLFLPDFAQGTPPSTDAAQYPAWDDLLAHYTATLERALEGVGAVEDIELDAPPRGDVPEMMQAYFPTLGATLNQIISHDAYHRGQMAMLVSE